MKKIIHLSDLHVGWKKKTNVRYADLIEYLIFVKNPATHYVVVVTGDIVDHASEDNYAQAFDGLKNLEKAGFTVLCVPGNHDYGSGSLVQKKYVKKFKTIFLNGYSGDYPVLNIIDDTAFIGLDSMAGELRGLEKLWANGEIGPKQRDRLADLLTHADVSACSLRVVYMHHHPMHPRALHELKDAKKFKRIVSGKIDVLLFGHNHDGFNFNGRWGIPRIYDGGSSTRKKGKTAAVRVIDFDRNPRWDYILDPPY